MRDPVPAVVPVNVTEQVPAEDNVQLLALSEPPVNVKVNVTVPVGVFEAVAVSVTVAGTVAVQLVAPRATLQLTSPTAVDVSSLPVTVTVTIATELMLPL